MPKFYATLCGTIEVVVEIDASTVKDARALLNEHGHERSIRQFKAVRETITGASLQKLEKRP